MHRLFTEQTSFTRDAQGRYVCNTLEEALESAKITGRKDGQHRPDARPFDIVIIGGGTFGAVAAHALFRNDALRQHRILVLEGGPFLVPEHVQNLPEIGLGVGEKTYLATLRELDRTANDLRSQGITDADNWAMNRIREIAKEVWGLAWHSPLAFPGLAYCIGGRSLYWGGWSPQLLDEEMPSPEWPTSMVAALNDVYFREASDQIGATSTNDYVYGELQRTWRNQLTNGYAAIRHAIPLNELPDHPGVRFADGGITRDELLAMLGLESSSLPDADLKNLLKIEAPLAVQSSPARSGTFPINKFSAMPLLIQAARQSSSESQSDDVRKRLMVVPNCHVKRLLHSGGRVTTVLTSLGDIQLPEDGKAIIALGAVESARRAKLSFGDIDPQDQIGRNLMAHLRSNIHLRVPRDAIVGAMADELQAAALFVKCRFTYPGTSRTGTFHLQLTAAGRGLEGGSYAEELNRTIPDIDTLDAFEQATESTVVITIRGIGEMTPNNPKSHVTLDESPGEVDEYGERRAYVSLEPSDLDLQLWDAMDDASNDVAKLFINGRHFDLLNLGAAGKNLPPSTDLKAVMPYTTNGKSNPKRRDGLGTTHHEAGTLRIGEVTDANGRFRNLTNAYAAGPALFPTIGSPNPMLTGVALSRRLADHLLPPDLAPPPPPSGMTSLLDGSHAKRAQWRFVGQGSMRIENSTLVLNAGKDLGLAYPHVPQGASFRLVFDVMIASKATNSGVFFGSWDPNRRVPRRNEPATADPYDNRAYVPVVTGYEVQIDELARGNPQAGISDGSDQSRTGAIYGVPLGVGAGRQQYNRGPELVPGQWQRFELEVSGNDVLVRIGGIQTSKFKNNDSYRGRFSSPGSGIHAGFIGFQAHSGAVAFANIFVA